MRMAIVAAFEVDEERNEGQVLMVVAIGSRYMMTMTVDISEQGGETGSSRTPTAVAAARMNSRFDGGCTPTNK